MEESAFGFPAGSSDPTGMTRGGYIILDSGSSTMTFVMPTQKMAMEVDLSSFGALAQIIKRDVADASSLVQDLGPGEQILGHPTRHVRTVRAYTMRISSPFDSSTSRVETETDEWRATDLAIGDALAPLLSRSAFNGTLPSASGAPGGSSPSTDTIPKGFTLREAVKSRTTASNGRVTATAIRMEVRDLQRAEINDDTFAVPADYRIMNPLKVRKPFTKDQREKFMRNCQESGSKEECERRLKFMDPGAAADTGKAAR